MHPPLITAEELQTRMGSRNLTILDATYIAGFHGRAETGLGMYQTRRVPGARYFDIDEIAYQDTDLPHMMPTPDVFERSVQSLGVNASDEIVVYDQNAFFASARVWWMLRAMGHDKVSVLDGGMNAWSRIEGEIETGEAIHPAVMGDFKAKPTAALYAFISTVEEAMGARTILDARPKGRFEGAAPEPRPQLPSGHIPSSRNVPYALLLSDDGYMKSTTELKAIISDIGVDPEDHIVTTCGSGVSAAVIALALARLGNDTVQVYDGSWAEWAVSGKPITTGPA